MRGEKVCISVRTECCYTRNVIPVCFTGTCILYFVVNFNATIFPFYRKSGSFAVFNGAWICCEKRMIGDVCAKWL